MYFGFKGELVRNTTAFFLVMVGVPLVILGATKKLDKVAECGGGLISAALLAFKGKTEQQQ